MPDIKVNFCLSIQKEKEDQNVIYLLGKPVMNLTDEQAQQLGQALIISSEQKVNE